MTDNTLLSRVGRGVWRHTGKTSVALLLMCFAQAAPAYVGPGAGLGALAALFAIVLAIVATIVGLILWPIRKFASRRKRAPTTEDASSSGQAERPVDPEN